MKVHFMNQAPYHLIEGKVKKIYALHIDDEPRRGDYYVEYETKFEEISVS